MESGDYSWKAKIHKVCLYDAIKSSCNSHFVHIWKNKLSKANPANDLSPVSKPIPSSQVLQKITIATWNCRGYNNSTPYLLHLISSGVDVIVLQEIWLWPYELTTLDRLHPEFSYTAVADEHLGPTSDLTRGCGGVAILWRKSLRFSPITAVVSDRICGVRLFLPHEQRCMTILGIYMPSSEHPQDLWNNLISNYNLLNVSLGCLASGPVHTFQSGTNATTIDYVVVNQDAMRGSYLALHSKITLSIHQIIFQYNVQ